MSAISNTKHGEATWATTAGRLRKSAIILLAITAAAISFCGRSAFATDICWKSGVTPDGHHYQVLYVPFETIKIATSRVPHRYMAVAFAVQGWIWAANDVPCGTIPWEHEMKHLDGWEHDANQHWTDKKPMPFTAADIRPPSWTIVKTADGYTAVRDELVAEAPAASDVN